MIFGVLGPLRPDTVTRPAQRRLLSILLLEAGRAVDRDVLIHRMWGDRPPPSARNSLHVHVNGLRRTLSDPAIVTTPRGYRIEVDESAFDVALFDGFARAARDAKDAQDRLSNATQGLELWRGDPYQELAGDDYAQPELVRLEERRVELIELRMFAILALGRTDEAGPELQELVKLFPLRERLHAALMLALYRGGRQTDALRHYRRVRHYLNDEVGIEPGPELRDIEQRILLQDPTLGAPAVVPVPHNLPSTRTSFVARDDDLRRVEELLGESRIVTVVGGPGFGKTRLATEVGWNMLDRFPAGVWVASLGSARSARDVAATIAGSAGVLEQLPNIEQLAAVLAPRPILLLLDSCEHVAESVARFTTALADAGGVARLLATSRHPLSVEGERVHRLAPLPTDETGAIRLIIDRIRSVDRLFRVTDDNHDALHTLVRRLEGIPLGLELVARWIPTLGLSDIDRLLASIDGENSLTNALEWNRGLLHESDREFLDGCAIFAGPFTIDRAHDVCTLDAALIATAGTVARLVDASLLERTPSGDGTVRYRMLQPIREWALPRSTRAARRRHREVFLSAAARVNDEGAGPYQATAFAAVDVEIADYRTAMGEFRDSGNWDAVAAIAAGLVRYWYSRFLAWEGESWLHEALDAGLSESVRIKALLASGFLAWAVHDYAEADRRYRDSLALARASADRRSEADALFGLGLVHDKRRFEDGAAMLRAAASIYEGLDHCARELGECRLFLGLRAASRGDDADAVALLTSAVALLESVGHLRQVSKGERWLAHAAWLRADRRAARAHAARAERLARDTSDMPALAGALIVGSLSELAWGTPSSAAIRLLGSLELIPAGDLVDVCQVLWPVAWLAEATHAPRLAADLLWFIDQVYDEAGWRPLDEMAGTLDLRQRVGSGGPRDDVLADAIGFLSEVATSNRSPDLTG